MSDASIARPSDPEMAAALDDALDALLAGRPLDRSALLAKHPGLADALAGLDRLVGQGSTLDGDPGVNFPPPSRPDRVGRYRIERELGCGGFGVSGGVTFEGTLSTTDDGRSPMGMETGLDAPYLPLAALVGD